MHVSHVVCCIAVASKRIYLFMLFTTSMLISFHNTPEFIIKIFLCCCVVALVGRRGAALALFKYFTHRKHPLAFSTVYSILFIHICKHTAIHRAFLLFCKLQLCFVNNRTTVCCFFIITVSQFCFNSNNLINTTYLQPLAVHSVCLLIKFNLGSKFFIQNNTTL